MMFVYETVGIETTDGLETAAASTSGAPVDFKKGQFKKDIQFGGVIARITLQKYQKWRKK